MQYFFRNHVDALRYKFVVEFLVDRVDCSVFAEDKHGMTILHHAASRGSVEHILAEFGSKTSPDGGQCRIDFKKFQREQSAKVSQW